MKARFSTVIFLCLWLLASGHQQETSTIPHLTKAATDIIQVLDSEQQETALLPFATDLRVDWHYIPKERKGIALKDMTAEQKKLSMGLLREILSQDGFGKLEGVIQSETILWQLSNQSDHRDPENYHLTFFGKPSNESTWGASFEGHHISINLTIIDGQEVFVTPSFLGSNPETSESGHQPLAAEFNRAKKLFDSLSKEQQTKATLNGTKPREILTRSNARVSAFEAEGIPVANMKNDQKTQLRNLMTEYIGRYREPFAQDDWEKIEAAGFDNLYFVWSSDPSPSRAIYYRIQGPTFVMEYANSQNHGNHSHTVWRDFENDFGYDALGSHFKVAN